MSRLPYQLGLDANKETDNNRMEGGGRTSTSSSNSGKDISEAVNGGGDNLGTSSSMPDAEAKEEAEKSPMDLVSSALDHIDIVIYTVLETLQGRVLGILRN